MFQSMKLRRITTYLFSGEPHLLRLLSTATTYAPPPVFQPHNHRHQYNGYIPKQTLEKLLWSVGPSGSMSQVLHDVIRNRGNFTKTDLMDFAQDLRQFGRYHQCLELLDWIIKGKFGYSDGDYASHLCIMGKVHGIDEVEKFFENIPPDAKKHYAYGALLKIYCTNMMTDKALAVFEKMDELNFALNHHDFNNLIGLFLKIGKPENVSSLVAEMKGRKILLTNNTYYMWISSYRRLLDHEGIEKVMLEVQEQDFVKEDWQIYTYFASAYIEFGQFEKAEAALYKVEELLYRKKIYDLKPYQFLISMYANVGNLQSVYQAWFKLKSKFQLCNNTTFLIMLRALSKLDDLEGLISCLKEWDSSYSSYDERLPGVAISAYLRHDKIEEAEQVLKDAEDKAKQKLKSSYIAFINYHIEKHQFNSALKHLEAAIANGWKPLTEKLDPFFEHFKEEKDVDSAEELIRILDKVQPLNLRTCSWLLQIYAYAGLTSPEMCQRMEALRKKC